jgi:PAS domain S-box-containing protein
MYEPLDRFFSHLHDITTKFHHLQSAGKESALSPRAMELYEALTLAVESLHTAESELRQQHEQVWESQQMVVTERERYYALFNGAPDAYLVTDVHGAIQEANLAATRLLKVPASFLKNKPLTLYILPEDRHAFRTLMTFLADAPLSERYEQDFTLQSRHLAEPIAISATVVPMRDYQEEVVGFRWLLRDVSQQRYDQAQLQSTNQLLRSLIDASPLAIIAVDTETRIQIWNPAAAQLFGSYQAEVMGMVAPNFILGEVAVGWNFFNDVKTRIEHHGVEVEYPHKDGTLIPVRLFMSPLQDAGGKTTGRIALIADLREEVQQRTDLRIIKSRLSATRNLERRRLAQDLHDDVIQQLVGSQFHLVFLRNLLDDANAPHLREVQAGLSQIGNEMAAMVRFLRVVISDLRPPGLEALGLKHSLETHVAQSLHTWRSPTPHIELQLSDEVVNLPMPVASVLLRVAQEALRNVNQHAEAQEVLVVLNYTDAEVILVVQDDGKGFVSPSRLTDLVHEGHFGVLGMAEQVEAVGGILHIAAVPGKGTTMTVTIPLIENVNAAEALA